MAQNFNPYAAPTAAPVGYPGAMSFTSAKAELGTRLLARILDFFIMLGAILPGALVTAFLSDRDPSILGIVLIIVPAFALTIYNWVLVHKQGQTIGKRALKIRIVKQDGSPCGFLHGVVLRDWVLHVLGRIPILGIIITLVNPLLIFGSERRCLHDMIAKTDVVRA